MFFVIIWYQQNLQAQSAQLEVVLGDPLPPPCPFSLPFPPLCPSCSPPQAPLLPHLWSQPFPHSLRQRHPCRLAGECWATLPLTRMGGPSPLCLHSKSKSSSNSVREPSRDVVAGKSALPLAATRVISSGVRSTGFPRPGRLVQTISLRDWNVSSN